MGQLGRGKKPMQRPLTRRCTGEYRGPRACAVRGLGFYLPAPPLTFRCAPLHCALLICRKPLPLHGGMGAILASLAGLSQPNQAR